MTLELLKSIRDVERRLIGHNQADDPLLRVPLLGLWGAIEAFYLQETTPPSGYKPHQMVAAVKRELARVNAAIDAIDAREARKLQNRIDAARRPSTVPCDKARELRRVKSLVAEALGCLDWNEIVTAFEDVKRARG